MHSEIVCIENITEFYWGQEIYALDARSSVQKKKDAHHDPFGAAKPVDTAAREAEMEKRIAEKRAQIHAQVEKDMENRPPRGDHRGERGGM